MSASDLFAQSQGSLNFDGETGQRCHWCGSACNQDWKHDDLPPIPFVKIKNQAKCPANHWICVGCWLWRRGRVTVTFVDGSYKDGQTASGHSWWVTDDSAKAVNSSCQHLLHSCLLKPPNRFVLTLITEGFSNNLHLAVANDVSIIEAETPLLFTINNIVSEYTVYDLETALKDPEASRTPGVRMLLKYFHPWEYPKLEKRRPVGKPPEVKVSEGVKKVISLSGSQDGK